MSRVRLFLGAVALLGLTACASLPQIVPGADGVFDVRYNPDVTAAGEADAQARGRCGETANTQFVSQDVRHDGLTYRTYRCVSN